MSPLLSKGLFSFSKYQNNALFYFSSYKYYYSNPTLNKTIIIEKNKLLSWRIITLNYFFTRLNSLNIIIIIILFKIYIILKLLQLVIVLKKKKLLIILKQNLSPTKLSYILK